MKGFTKIALGILISAIVLGMSVSVFAGELPTGADVQGGNSTPPIVKAKWETPDNNPIKPWTQITPNMTFNGTKTVTYWMVVTDPDGIGELYEGTGSAAGAYVDVYHPDGTFKYQVELNPLYTEIDCREAKPIVQTSIGYLKDADNKSLVTFGGKSGIIKGPFYSVNQPGSGQIGDNFAHGAITKEYLVDSIRWNFTITDTSDHYGVGMALNTDSDSDPEFQVWFKDYATPPEDPDWWYQPYGATCWSGTPIKCPSGVCTNGIVATGSKTGNKFTITIPKSLLGSGSQFGWVSQVRTTLLGVYPNWTPWCGPFIWENEPVTYLYNLSDVVAELEQCSALIYKGIAPLDYHQMCGEFEWQCECVGGPPCQEKWTATDMSKGYRVDAYAFDKGNQVSSILKNYFEYICTPGIELDFNSLNFGSVVVSSNKWIEGDYEFNPFLCLGTAKTCDQFTSKTACNAQKDCSWGTNGPCTGTAKTCDQFTSKTACNAQKDCSWGGPACAPGLATGCRAPTIRNIGNIPVKINVTFDDMGFGYTGPETNKDWNVEWDARLHLNPAKVFNPFNNTYIGNMSLCNRTKITFSMHVKKTVQTGLHNGTVTIEPQAVSFPWW